MPVSDIAVSSFARLAVQEDHAGRAGRQNGRGRPPPPHGRQSWTVRTTGPSRDAQRRPAHARPDRSHEHRLAPCPVLTAEYF
jgi:hypothetical protein